MNDYVVSLIRTWVGVAVGAFVAYLGTRWHIVISSSSAEGVIVAFTGLVTGLWYALVRTLETHWPAFGHLLGVPRTPRYVEPSPPSG